MLVQHVMSHSVMTVRPETPFKELWKMIFKSHVNALPVVDGKGTLVGIITREDVMRFLYPNYQEYIQSLLTSLDFEEMEEKIHELTPMKAKQFMSTRVIYTRTDTPIMRALSRMLARRLNQLPVLNPKGKVVGMVTKGDIFYALFKAHLSGAKKK